MNKPKVIDETPRCAHPPSTVEHEYGRKGETLEIIIPDPPPVFRVLGSHSYIGVGGLSIQTLERIAQAWTDMLVYEAIRQRRDLGTMRGWDDLEIEGSEVK